MVLEWSLQIPEEIEAEEDEEDDDNDGDDDEVHWAREPVLPPEDVPRHELPELD